MVISNFKLTALLFVTLLCTSTMFFSLNTFAFVQAQIALIQYDSDLHFSNRPYNLNKLTEYLLEAVQNNSKIIVFPEGSIYGYDTIFKMPPNKYKDLNWCRRDISQGCLDVDKIAELVPNGRTTNYFSKFSKKFKVYILFNLIQKKMNNRTHSFQYLNTTVVVGPSGFVGFYSKKELTKIEDLYDAESGETEFVLKTEFGNFGLLICRDIVQNGHLESYAQNKDVQAVILMSSWAGDPYVDRVAARTFFQKRSTEVNLPIYASDSSNSDGTGLYWPSLPRRRHGLAEISIDQAGISYHKLNF